MNKEEQKQEFLRVAEKQLGEIEAGMDVEAALRELVEATGGDPELGQVLIRAVEAVVEAVEMVENNNEE